MKSITYAQFRKAIQESREQGYSPDTLIMPKPKVGTKSILIAGKKFMILPCKCIGSLDGINVHLDENCPLNRWYLVDSTYMGFQDTTKPKPFLKPAMDKTMQKMLKGYAPEYPNGSVLIPIWRDPKIIDATLKQIPFRDLIPRKSAKKEKKRTWICSYCKQRVGNIAKLPNGKRICPKCSHELGICSTCGKKGERRDCWAYCDKCWIEILEDRDW